jgi:ComF family protein
MFTAYNHIFEKLKVLGSHVYHACLDVLSPPCCAYCKHSLAKREVFCPGCEAKLQPVISVLLPVTATKTIKVLGVAAYQYPIKQLVLAKSYGDVIASYQLAQLMWERTDVRALEFDVIVPIPLHWTRRVKRGFNQAHEIADYLSKKSGKPVVPLLRRTKHTLYQAALRSGDRAQNVADAFTLHSKYAEAYKGKHILIVDDLMTTGSTLRVAAKELYTLKPAAITAVVAARVV